MGTAGGSSSWLARCLSQSAQQLTGCTPQQAARQHCTPCVGQDPPLQSEEEGKGGAIQSTQESSGGYGSQGKETRRLHSFRSILE